MPGTYRRASRKTPRRSYPSRRYSTRRVTRRGRSYVPRPFGNARAVTEKHYFDSQLAATSIFAATASWGTTQRQDPATLLTLFAPTQGDDISQRSGRKVAVTSIKIRFMLTKENLTTATSPLATVVRLLVVQDKQTNGAQMDPANVLGTTSGTGLAVLQYQNPANFGRFRVLCDKSINFHNPDFIGNSTMSSMIIGPQQAHFTCNIRFKQPVIIHYNATNGGTVADVVDNSFHIMAGVNDNTQTHSIAYRCRTTFMDLA